MERNLYRVNFLISASGNIDDSLKGVKRILIQTPDPYIGTEVQIRIFQKQAFKKKLEKEGCIFESQVHYIGSELIPNIPKTADMIADIVIGSGNWV